MPNGPVPAAAEGLPETLRSSDPLAALITEYRHQTALFNERAQSEPWDKLTAATYGPVLDRLWHATPEPTSSAGVAAAIALALDEPDLYARDEIMKACLRYLNNNGEHRS